MRISLQLDYFYRSNNGTPRSASPFVSHEGIYRCFEFYTCWIFRPAQSLRDVANRAKDARKHFVAQSRALVGRQWCKGSARLLRTMGDHEATSRLAGSSAAQNAEAEL